MEAITEEQLAEVERFARGFASPKTICLVMEWDFAEMQSCFTNMQHPVARAYHKGKEKRILEINLVVVDQAAAGSSVAQALAEKLSEDQSVKEANELG